jgi:hypothetical protein
MDEPYTYHTVRYVLRNPVRAGIVRLPWRYEWLAGAKLEVTQATCMQ